MDLLRRFHEPGNFLLVYIAAVTRGKLCNPSAYAPEDGYKIEFGQQAAASPDTQRGQQLYGTVGAAFGSVF